MPPTLCHPHCATHTVPPTLCHVAPHGPHPPNDPHPPPGLPHPLSHPFKTCGNCPADCGPCQPTEDIAQCVEPAVYALTFDDGPSPNSNALMDILASNGVKASFFLVGTQVEQFPAQINREVRGCQRAGS
jgi:hypothetical protein